MSREALELNDRLIHRLKRTPLLVLYILSKRQGCTLAHDDIAERFFDLDARRIDRDAIYRAVQHIRKSGVEVVTDHSLGYRLDAPPPMRV